MADLNGEAQQAQMERYVLRNARHLAADYMKRTIRPGDTVVDATMGNGKDTLFLAELVGETGRVHAFDVQAEAVERTRERVEEAGFVQRVSLHLAGHETMKEHVQPGIQAVMFNLGWLPGAQHAVTTLTETTLAAVQAACELIAPGGIVTVCVYPGHDEGKKELSALDVWAAELPVRTYNVLRHHFVNAALYTPQLFLIQKNS